MSELVIDSFAGGGGASLGIEQAIGRPVDIAINHDREAVAMHIANHPRTRHYQQDIWKVHPLDATRGRPVALAWFSPDCKHFSKAKGGRPVEKSIRDLAWVVVEWAKAVRPRVIMLENVEEFRTWGPLGEDNRPHPERKGETFEEWCGQLRALGYELEWRELRACDYGAPTIRKRLFVIARCDGEPIRWPIPTHGKGLLPYRTAAECIDWWRPCPSIFDRPKPLAEATLRRIANGIRRYVIEAAEPFIVRTGHYSNITGEGDTFRGQSTTKPLSTVTSVNDYGLVTPYLVGITHNQSNGMTDRADEPLRTLTTSKGGELALVAPTIVRNNHDGQGKPADAVADPLATVTTQHNKHALVAAFLAKHFGGNETPGAPLADPAPTVTARDHNALVTSNLVKLYGTNNGADVVEPLPTVTAGGNHVAEVRAFLAAYYGNERDGQAMLDPFRTVTSKERFGLVVVHGEPYQIVDIGMRMLAPRELFRAQGFPEGYVIAPLVDGKPLTKTAQIRMCGNSVCPPAARALVEANVGRMGQQAMWPGYEMAAAAGGGL